MILKHFLLKANINIRTVGECGLAVVKCVTWLDQFKNQPIERPVALKLFKIEKNREELKKE
ncbi:17573_t:CDS:1, partial [Gigaspora rosea]